MKTTILGQFKKKQLFLVSARFIFWGPRLFFYYLLLVTFVRTKTSGRYFYFIPSSPQLSTEKTLNI